MYSCIKICWKESNVATVKGSHDLLIFTDLLQFSEAIMEHVDFPFNHNFLKAPQYRICHKIIQKLVSDNH